MYAWRCTQGTKIFLFCDQRIHGLLWAGKFDVYSGREKGMFTRGGEKIGEFMISTGWKNDRIEKCLLALGRNDVLFSPE